MGYMIQNFDLVPVRAKGLGLYREQTAHGQPSSYPVVTFGGGGGCFPRGVRQPGREAVLALPNMC
jgi:hypothetical protein